MELQGVNFELALTSYKYVAILFYNDSELGRRLELLWHETAEGLKDSLDKDVEMAKVSALKFYTFCLIPYDRLSLGFWIRQLYADNADGKEITDAYGITTPSIQVFRRGILSDYRVGQPSNGLAPIISCHFLIGVGFASVCLCVNRALLTTSKA